MEQGGPVVALAAPSAITLSPTQTTKAEMLGTKHAAGPGQLAPTSCSAAPSPVRENQGPDESSSEMQRTLSGASTASCASSISLSRDSEARHAVLSLDVSRVELLQLIGAGAFGRVHLARVGFQNSAFASKYCAVKSMSKTDIIFAGKARQMSEEQRIMAAVHGHPFIMTVLRSFQTSTHLHLITELAEQGDLYVHLRRRGRFTESAARFYTAEVLLALEHCHERGIVFRDLKPENVLLGARGHAKLADFGLAVDLCQRCAPETAVPPKLYTMCGSDDYIAPEVLRGHGYGAAVDLWALGCLAYEMLTGCPPFHERTLPVAAEAAATIRARERLVARSWPQEGPGSDRNQHVVRITDARHSTFARVLMEPANIPSQLSEDAQRFLDGLLQKSPTKRTGFATTRCIMTEICQREASLLSDTHGSNVSEKGAGILSVQGIYADSVKAEAFLAPLDGVRVDTLIDCEGPVLQEDLSLVQSVSSFLRARLGGVLDLARAARPNSPSPMAESTRTAVKASGVAGADKGPPMLEFTSRELAGTAPGLPLDNCAEAAVLAREVAGDTAAQAKLAALRTLGNSIFSGYAYTRDDVIFVQGQQVSAASRASPAFDQE